MALRGKRKREKAKRGAMSDTRNTNEGKRGQRSRRYGHKNKEERHTEPGTEQRGKAHRTGNQTNSQQRRTGAAALIATKKKEQKQRLNNGTSKSIFNNFPVSFFNNSPVCVESQHTRVRVGARSVYQERNERKKKTRRARKKERKKKMKEERKRA